MKTFAEQVGSEDVNLLTSDLHLGGSHIEFQPGHRLAWDFRGFP
jgi:hypothetical protein